MKRKNRLFALLAASFCLTTSANCWEDHPDKGFADGPSSSPNDNSNQTGNDYSYERDGGNNFSWGADHVPELGTYDPSKYGCD